MKDILAPFYFVYVVLLFLISMLPFYVFMRSAKLIVGNRTFINLLYKNFKLWMGIFMPMIFCPVKLFGRERFIHDENYVVIINHNSFMDIPVSAPGIPGASKTLAKIEISKVPLFGFLYTSGSILVDRKDKHSKANSYGQMEAALKDGIHLGLYPEGTRNKTKALLAPFHDGAFKVAIKTQKDIIPSIILGTKHILHPTKKIWAWPHKIEFHFLEKISVHGKTLKDLEDIKQTAHQQMLQFLELHKAKL